MKPVVFFIILTALSATCSAETVKHNHGGREHAHGLPSEGIKHSHNSGALGSSKNIPGKSGPSECTRVTVGGSPLLPPPFNTTTCSCQHQSKNLKTGEVYDYTVAVIYRFSDGGVDNSPSRSVAPKEFNRTPGLHIFTNTDSKINPPQQFACEWNGRQYKRGNIYTPPKSTSSSSSEADAYQKDCDRGEMADCADLGVLYERGEGVPQDENKANQLFQKACSNGDSGGCSHLGNSYRKGMGVPQDENKANQLFQKACNGGSMVGCVILGGSYSKGRGVPQNHRKASQLFKKACDGKQIDGCVNLGILYFNGEGVPQDRRRAEELFNFVCRAGSLKGCNLLIKIGSI